MQVNGRVQFCFKTEDQSIYDPLSKTPTLQASF